MNTLSFGYKNPETGDKGAVVFNALNDNIVQMNAHDHDGTDSDRIDSYDLRKGTVSVDATSWLASGSVYRKLVTFPTGYSTANSSDWGKAHIKIFLSGGTLDGREVLPSMEKVSATTFYLYSPFNNQAFTLAFN